MIFKKSSLLLTGILIACLVIGQNTFNTRSYGVVNTIYNSVQVLEDGYLTCGWTYDTIPDVHMDILMTKFNLEGENTAEFHYGESGFETFTQQDGITQVPNLYVQQGHSFDATNVEVGRLIWYNDAGDTLKTKDLYSPYFLSGGDDSILPLYNILMADSTIYLTGTIFQQETTGNDMCLWHLDKDGNELWHYIYATEANPESCYGMIPWQEGVLAPIYKGFGDPYLSGLKLLHLLSNGYENALIDESTWDNFSADIQALINDNNKIVCGGAICEAEGLTSRCAIWKLNENFELIWNTPIGDYPEVSNAFNIIRNLVETTDGNYVATSDDFFSQENPFSYHTKTRVVKVDHSTGAVIWQRYYHYVESQFDIHSAIDMKATPDGGVVFCGHASDTWTANPDLELPAQQGWLVKLDACGCLVPGCDMNCVVGINDPIENETQIRFLYGPNPSSLTLNVYLTNALINSRDCRMKLYDLSGKCVLDFQTPDDDTTYIIDVERYESGNYVLSLEENGKVLQQEQILIH